MTVRELVLKLLLDARGVAAGSAASQQSLDGVSSAANRAGDEMRDAANRGKKGLGEVSGAAKKTGDDLKNAADKGGSAFERLTGIVGKAMAVIGGVAFLKSAAAQYFANADAVGKLSKSLSQNTQDMQAWGQAASRAGGSAEAFYGTLDTLGGKIREAAKGGGEAAGVLRKLGISPRENGQVKDTTRLLLELSDVMQGMSQQQAFDYGQKLGIDPGTIMLLQSGRREVESLVKRQKELGVYTKEDAEIAARANNAFADMGQALQGVAAVFMRVAGPALTWLADKLTAVAVWVRKNEPFILALFTGLAAIIAGIALPAIKAFAAAVLAAIAPFTPLILVIGGIALLIDDLIRYMRGGKSAFADLWSQFGTGEEIAEKLRKAWELLQEAGKKLFAFLISGVRTAFQVFGNLIDAAVSLYKMFEALINLDFESMGQWGDSLLESIGRIITAVGNLIVEFLDMFGMWEPLKEGHLKVAAAIISAWEGVKKWFQDFFDWVLKTWDSIKEIPGNIADTVGSLPGKAADAVSSGWNTIKDFVGFGPENKGEKAAAGNSTTTNNRTTHIGQVVVQTQATDAQGIANGMGAALGNTVNQADGAFG